MENGEKEGWGNSWNKMDRELEVERQVPREGWRDKYGSEQSSWSDQLFKILHFILTLMGAIEGLKEGSNKISLCFKNHTNQQQRENGL